VVWRVRSEVGAMLAESHVPNLTVRQQLHTRSPALGAYQPNIF
jgi:hypothetical protein